ncbi:hypothetical protein [Curtobacterium sp. VKM Ac-1393]|uniref:hypothetical protein n=1 Tax=Curtobacterium sp. VKM Ac-1393 TaxID=2783814 RepID=UPI00188D9D3A|nr:hypothetical protein [Curtobacterium sp. VKM Ac-1393]MBF4606668.1 hypothetical protein [Curtobacterium sp. VKM Ac-1393]
MHWLSVEDRLPGIGAPAASRREIDEALASPVRLFAWLAVVAAALMLALGLLNLLLNTRMVGSWLPLVVLMPWSLYLGIWSLRNQDKR